ncbi:FtsX-like permease family protein [Allostreptomyces psammosilenae]|uniref:Putative ABC transport system permease protein n=1 Tax=Allostreptomyces psammosilenae TaxID=1892865 RepID=A0A852ZWK6_9ACTN|nr:FtsX-like permease family protein [Allostreptomyces psammosilenae]NYI05134.1 putative ABC transport system permease protein [Allostreptomyces psammosilenae]
MIRLSLSTVRERWQLFLGAIVAIALGVALTQSSLLVLLATEEPRLPPGLSAVERHRISEGYVGAATLMGMTVLICFFLAVFVVGSTAAFTVAQRRADLALLRLVGAKRGQLRLLLLSEALILGLLGTLAGIPLGLAATGAQAWLLTALGFFPEGAAVGWDGSVLWVSGGLGVAVALLGVRAAARQAARVGPLEALREVGAAARVMTAGRWLRGLLFLAVSAAMVWVSAAATDLLGALVIALAVLFTGPVAMSALSPVVVPLAGRALGVLLRGSTLGGLAMANLRAGVRRSASVAAPLIVLVALSLGLWGTLASLSTAAAAEYEHRILAGDLVVESTGAQADRLASVAGVETAAPRLAVEMTVAVDGREYHAGVVAVDALGYRRTHRWEPLRAGSLEDLRGRTIAVGPALATEGLRVGGTATARIDGREVPLRIVAALPEILDNGADAFLVPRDLVPPELAARAPAETVIRLLPGAEPAVVAEAIRSAGLGEVRTVAEWAGAKAAEAQRGNLAVLGVLMGLGGLYALVAVVNAVVIAGADRGAEFAAARLAGLSRPQVVWTALVEAWSVTLIGLFLGCLVVAGALSGIATSTMAVLGEPAVAVPWGMLGAVCLGAFATIGAATCCVTLAATRPRPVTLATTRG